MIFKVPAYSIYFYLFSERPFLFFSQMRKLMWMLAEGKTLNHTVKVAHSEEKLSNISKVRQ